MKLTGSKQILIAVAVCALLLLGGFVYALWYVYGVAQELQTTRRAVAQGRDTSGQLGELQQLVNRTQADRDRLDQFTLPSQVVPFLEQLERMATSSQLQFAVNSLSTPKGAKDSVLEQLTIGASAEGRFENLYHFLRSVEAMPYRLSFQQAELTYLSNDPRTGPRWRLAFMVTVLKNK